jgi:hypothetical protein
MRARILLQDGAGHTRGLGRLAAVAEAVDRSHQHSAWMGRHQVQIAGLGLAGQRRIRYRRVDEAPLTHSRASTSSSSP